MKFILPLLVLLVIIGGGAYLYSHKTVEAPASITETPSSSQSTKIIETDLTGANKLPAGFPSDIPVEMANVTESYAGQYQSLNATQYSVSYTSKQAAGTLWDSYSAFMSQSGYTINPKATSKSVGQISGTKNGDTLSVVISSHNGTSLVHLSYLDKP